MPLQDQISHAAAVAKWKVDQQSRILKAQNKIRETENQISARKWALAEKTYQLFCASGINEEELTEQCQQIQMLYKNIDEMQLILESIRSESLPAQVHPSTHPAQTDTGAHIVCPKCHTPVPVRFCPNCGSEGIIR